MGKKNKKDKRKEKSNNRIITELRRKYEEKADLKRDDYNNLSWLDDYDDNQDEVKEDNTVVPNEDHDSTYYHEDLDIQNLYVFEPADLNDMNLSEVQKIWDMKSLLCGSRESAAEVLALLEVGNGIVETYQGWQRYVDREEVVNFKSIAELDTCDNANIEIIRHPKTISKESIQKIEADTGLKFDQVKLLNLSALKNAWSNRYERFLTLSAACLALSRLRYLTGIDKAERHWKEFIDFPEIAKIDNLLDDYYFLDTSNCKEIDISSDDSHRSMVEMGKKSSKISLSDQSNFRREVVKFYGNRCCITGCCELSLLEVVYVTPYMGTHSNIIQNSLCVRIDISRLFREFLMSIEPLSKTIVVSKKVTDKYYSMLNDNILDFDIEDVVFTKMLSRHYQTFCRLEKSRLQD